MSPSVVITLVGALMSYAIHFVAGDFYFMCLWLWTLVNNLKILKRFIAHKLKHFLYANSEQLIWMGNLLNINYDIITCFVSANISNDW